MDPIRQQARRIMVITRQHETARHRQYQPPPHTGWGCTRECYPDNLTHYNEALALALHVGGIVLTPQATYAPGWMRPA